MRHHRDELRLENLTRQLCARWSRSERADVKISDRILTEPLFCRRRGRKDFEMTYNAVDHVLGVDALLELAVDECLEFEILNISQRFRRDESRSDRAPGYITRVSPSSINATRGGNTHNRKIYRNPTVLPTHTILATTRRWSCNTQGRNPTHPQP